MIDFNNNIYLGVASPDMERDLSNYYTKAQTRALVDTKQDIITGAATTITEDNLTANRAVISNASGKVAVSNVTSTELGYLSGVTSSVQTQLNNKASTSLDNLSAAGQMIIDSQNGTISNCILEIPQNIKLTLENNVLTLKTGSIITLPGNTYTTVTTTQDNTLTISTDDTFVVFSRNNGLSIGNYVRLNKIGSGSSLPADSTTYQCFYNSTDKLIYLWNNNQWIEWNVGYPLCVIKVENGNMSFAKDSNGNDMIFNGACFVGHHAVVYPNSKIGLVANGFNSDRTLSSIVATGNSLYIVELTGNPSEGYKRCVYTISTGGIALFNYNEVKDVSELNNNSVYYSYVINKNLVCHNTVNGITAVTRLPIISFTLSGTTVTDFTIRQPYQGARNLLTDDLYKQIGDVETLLAAI